MNGEVKFFNRKKGFGFIKGEDEKEYFVHFSALTEGTMINDNDRVTFDPSEGDRGLQAQNVSLAQGGSEAPEEESKEEPKEKASEDF
ncbi:cold-shock protein [Candidatus Woesearchaeota archaeon B3_Woes]|nr:MAG: cold-shock protein [Candidatus Woesearchaeota archaeon B3_Woes]